MRQEMIIIGEDNKEIKCNIVARWNNNGNSYIAYTDGTMKDGKKELYVSKIHEEKGKFRLLEISDDNEWNYVNEFLKSNYYDEGENYE